MGTMKLVENLNPLSKVLVIDDAPDTHIIINAALRNSFQVVNESSGSNALNHALTERPDFILLDLNMPHIDGFEVLEQIRRHPELSSIPIFCLSAYSDEANRERAYKAGASGFINKPINIKNLSNDLSKILQGLNTLLVSKDSKSKVFIAPSESEMNLWFQNQVAEIKNAGKKVIILSIRSGTFYTNNLILEMVKNNEAIYMQIKPSLITRLPFLDDLSGVMMDLKKLLDDGSSSYSVIIDRPELVLLSPSNDNKTATILTFSEALSKHFWATYYLCKKPATPFEIPAIMEMSKFLVRQF